MATYTVGAAVKIAATVNNYSDRSGVVDYITDDLEPIYGVRLDGDNWISQFSRAEIAGPITYTVIAWQLARMDADATEADARAALIEAQTETALIVEAPAMLELLREMLCAEKCRPWHPEIRAILARIDAATDEDDQVCRNGKAWADCNYC